MSNPSPERDPEVLELFIEESVEALTRVEALLLDAELGKAAPDMLARLFRDLHTMKGTSGFLALPKTGVLSHAAEDLLARLRDEPARARPEHYRRLLEALDQLRQLVDSVRASGDEPPALDVEPASAALRAAALQLDSPPTPPTLMALPTVVAAVVPTLTARSVAPTVAIDSVVPAAATPTAPPDEVTKAGESSDASVRVNVAVLDRLMNLMGELVLARNQVIQSVKSHTDGANTGQAALQRLSLVTSELQEQIMKTRMQPVARVFEKIPRMVRDLCQVTHKRVSCQIEGNATEIDRALVDAIRDPVMHLVRNAVDHGFEMPADRERVGKPAAGKLVVRASHEGGMVLIEIADDGRGIDPRALREHAVRKGLITAVEADRLSDREALELIFRPGFSTAEKVTSISGRGVGMDVVRTHAERAGGQVEMESTLGKGTTIRLKMPLTMAIIPALLVRSGSQRFAIPQVNLTELVHLDEQHAATAIEMIRGAPVYRLRGEMLPLVRLGAVLQAPEASRSAEGGTTVVVVAVGSCRYGLVVDEIDGTEEIVIKPLHGELKRLACYSGATVLGDGSVALILEVAGIAATAGIDTSSGGARRQAEENSRPPVDGPQPLLVFNCGDGSQCAVPLAIVARLEQVPSRTIERVGGAEVVQYRQTVMPIVRPELVLPMGSPPLRSEQHLVVFDFGQMVGMAVDSIVDVVEAPIEAQAPHDLLPLTLGKLVLFGKTTLLLDAYALVRKLVPGFVNERRQRDPGQRPRVLLADDSNALRAAVSFYLRAQGFEVTEAPSGEAAIRELRSPRGGPFDALVTDLEMSPGDGFDVLQVAKRDFPKLPVLVWTQHEDGEAVDRARRAGARSCINKMEREQLMVALAELGLGAGQGRRRTDQPRAA